MKLIVSALTIGLAALGFTQLGQGDHGNLKGSNPNPLFTPRTGVNGDVPGSGPGYLQTATAIQSGSLRWFRPFISVTPVEALRLNEINPLKTIIDNTDYQFGSTVNFDSSGNVVGPYDPLPLETFASQTGTWNTPTVDEEAIAPYTLAIRRNINFGNPLAFQGRNPNNRFPEHLWTRSTPSLGGVGGDPRQAILPGSLSTFAWTFSPHLSVLTGGVYVQSYDPTPKGYALYVWIPQGLVAPGGVAMPRPRYWAYEITYGIGQKYVDIVDTEAAGGGWVRLGNGGRPTNQLFQYAGLDGGGVPYPITIRLFNTIPRDKLDQLTEVVNAGNPGNRFAYFADAAMFSAETDNYIATPTSAGFGSTDVRVSGARNEVLIDPSTIPAVGADWRVKPNSVENGVVRSFDYNTGNERWRYSPSEVGPTSAMFDDTSVRFASTPGFAPAVDNPNARGGQYLKALANTVATTDNVTVNPQTDIADGSYQVFMYVGGDVGGATPVQYAHAAQYEIFEGGVSAGRFTIDLSTPGWKQLGNRRYIQNVAGGNLLKIRMENGSSLPADALKSIYVDQFRFVGAEGTSIHSSPVHATAMVRHAPGAAPVLTNVVMIADERGRIHCLDATGNGDGTTTCYWTYPSFGDQLTDPNNNPGLDPTDPNIAGVYQAFDGAGGVRTAQMATDFDISTATVRRLTAITTPTGPIDRDFLVIGSKSGRVYSIAMEGRGDFATGRGTTFRNWTYPETYPATIPKTTQLGAISSIVSAQLTIAGNPTDVEIVATEQGRIYCLNARGDFNYGNNRQLETSIIWQYPAANSPTLPAIVGAPTLDVANGRLFFGTRYLDDNVSRFMALDATTGAPLWATTNGSITDTYVDPNGFGPPTQLDWLSGSAYVPAATLNVLPTTSLTPMPDTVFAMNENGGVYAINAATGAVIWRTQELQSGGVGSLIYTEMRTYNAVEALGQYPVIMVPTEGGRFAALFARLGEETRFGNRLAWGYQMNSSIQSTMAISNKWLFGASTNGYLLAWSDLGNAGSTLGPGDNGPGSESIPDNDPNYDSYRNCEVAYLSRQGFVNLRQTLTGTITGIENYAQVINNGLAYSKPYGKLIAPYKSTHGAAFEWGETIYLIAYNFPFTTQDTAGNDVSPPIVEATVTTEGRAGRPVVAEARLFRDKTSADSDGGYAIFAIPLTAGGGTSHTPGPGTIRVQIRTSAVNRNNTQQAISLDPSKSTLTYAVANPLGLSIEKTFRTNPTSSLGDTIIPTREDALANGSPNLPTVTGVGPVRGDLFGTSVGNVAHGSSKKTNVYVLDRSLITLLRGEGRGLDLVKVDRKDLRWQGGPASVYKPFSLVPGIGGLLGNFEDLPGNFPNNSLDYPDIQREQAIVRKSPNGNVENPVFNTVSLTGPVSSTGGFVDETNYTTRTIVPTIFEFEVDVPKYQPVNSGANSIPNQDSTPLSTFWSAGYAGRFTVYVDSDQSGTFGGGLREAYRSFNLAAAVSPDERIVIGTPNVDLGSLASGAGYDARLTYSPTFPYRTLNPGTFFSPYDPVYSKMFKPFTAFNEGNVNLFNVRIAKGSYDVTGGLYWPWQVISGGNNADVWIDSAVDVHSNLDGRFAPEFAPGFNPVFAAKARVGDSIGHAITVNPTSRVNPNLINSGFPLIAGNANLAPNISVTPPLGTPIGRYSQLMRLVEDTGGSGPAGGSGDQSLSIGYTASRTVIPYETFSDPTFTLTFNVKETQLTGGRSQYVAGGFHEGNVVDPAHPSQWQDTQPSGLRTQDGNLLMAFASNRPDFYPVAGNPNPNNRNNRIIISSVAGTALGAADGRGQDSQIRDLNKFTPNDPANQRWFSAIAALPNISDANIFLPNLTKGVGTPFNIGGTLTGDVSYANPVWSTNGDKDLSGGQQGTSFVAYTGTAKRQTNSGIVDDSRIILTEVSLSGGVGATHVLDADPFLLKGRPSIVQNGKNVYVFYPALSNGIWSIYETTYSVTTGFSTPITLQFGSGFESVSNPAVVLRNVSVFDTEAFDVNNANYPPARIASTEFDLSFTGRLRNSSVSEVFMARLDPNLGYRTYGRVNFIGAPVIAGTQISENAVYDSRFGAYRVRGSVWHGTYGISINGASILTSAPSIDRQTKLQSATTIFGGRAIIDSELGTIKFTGAPLPKTAQILVTYTPTFMRLSETGIAGYTSPSLVFDNRLESSNNNVDYSLWKTPSGADETASSANTFADRLVMSAVRSATAGGQTSRPTMATYRLGIRVGRSILTNPDGSLAETLTITGNSGSYQIDPAAGRIYFTRLDEEKPIRIQLNGAGLTTPVDITAPVAFVGETAESFITMENPVNESNLYMFLDPVGTIANRRGMIWMLWSSTRNGAPSIFMETVARKIIPVLPPN